MEVIFWGFGYVLDPNEKEGDLPLRELEVGDFQGDGLGVGGWWGG